MARKVLLALLLLLFALSGAFSACATATEQPGPANSGFMPDAETPEPSGPEKTDPEPSRIPDDDTERSESDTDTQWREESKSENTTSECANEGTNPSAESGSGLHSDPSDIFDARGFVDLSEYIPDIEADIRYASSYNFVGEPIDGYEKPVALLSREAAEALKEADMLLKGLGYRLKIFDAYRPQSAVDRFVRWASDPSDIRMKESFYPDLPKSRLISGGYIDKKSGHSRGSKVDLTLVDSSTGEEVDMGGSYDWFGPLSHPDYRGIKEEQYRNRMILQQAMTACGFVICETEWWDFRLKDEPYPHTYFDFPVACSSLSGRSENGHESG